MKRFLAAAALAFLPMTAHATIGFTHHQGFEYETRGYGMSPYNTHLPSLDFYPKGWIVQVDVLETLSSISKKGDCNGTCYEFDGDNDEASGLHIGFNLYKKNKAEKGKVKDDVAGVFQPGVSFDIDTNSAFDPTSLYLLGNIRMGAQAVKSYGFGMYIVPGLGLAVVPDPEDGDNTVGLAVGGHLQVSAWSKKKNL